MSERTRYVDIDLIYKLCQTYATAISEGDVERLLALWCKDGIQMPPNRPRRKGRQQIVQALRQLSQRFSVRSLSILPENIQVLGRWAYAQGTFSIENSPKGSESVRQYRGNFLWILAKQADGSWVIFMDCHNLEHSCPKGVD